MTSAKLVFLGRLEDVAQTSEMTTASGPLTDILATLDPKLSEALACGKIKLALNGAIVADFSQLILASGDELAFLPPVSGG